MSHTTDSMTFEIFVGISFSSLLLFPGHGDIQKVSSTLLSDRLIPRWKKFSKTTVDGVVQWSDLVSIYRVYNIKCTIDSAQTADRRGHHASRCTLASPRRSSTKCENPLSHGDCRRARAAHCEIKWADKVSRSAQYGVMLCVIRVPSRSVYRL